MPLIRCETCVKEYSSDAPKCPNCHANNPHYEGLVQKTISSLKKLTKSALVGFLLMTLLTVAYSAFKTMHEATEAKQEDHTTEKSVASSDVPQCDTDALQENVENTLQQQNQNLKVLAISSNFEINYDKDAKTRSCLGNFTLTVGKKNFLYTFSESKTDRGNYILQLQPVTFDASQYLPKKMNDEVKSLLTGDWVVDNSENKVFLNDAATLKIDELYSTLQTSNGTTLVCRNIETIPVLKLGFCFKNKVFDSNCIGKKSTIAGTEILDTGTIADCPALETYTYSYNKEKIWSSTVNESFIRQDSTSKLNDNKEAEMNDPQQQFEMGEKLENGTCQYIPIASVRDEVARLQAVDPSFRVKAKVNGNPQNAVKFYIKAAEAGHKEAQFRLGQCYMNGIGIKEDRAVGTAWVRKSAEDGDSKKRVKLAEILLDSSSEVEWQEGRKLAIQLKKEMNKVLPNNNEENKKATIGKVEEINKKESVTDKPECEPYRETPNGEIRGTACKQEDGTYKIIRN